jgi:uncharacterized protein YkwD
VRRARRRVAVALLLAACAAPERPPAPAPAAASPPVPSAARPPMEQAGGGPRYGAEPRVAATPVEARAADLVRARFSGARPSGALALAARELARRAAAGDPSLERDRVRAALARGLSYDAGPAAYSVSSGRDTAPAALGRALPEKGRASHYGVGAWEEGERVWLVLLTADRKATLSPFPREVPAGATAVLSGRLDPPLLHPRVFATAPTGEVREAAVSGGRAFEARMTFPEPGRYLVEVVAQSAPGGPEVAALLTVAAGGAALEPPRRAVRAPEPKELRAAEASVVDEVNAVRRARGLAPVASAPALAAVARAHSAKMLDLRTLAHVLPGSGDLGERLRRARIPYARAFENVAMGGTTLAAHEAAEESPAHLGNILAPGATHVGVGVARGTGATGHPVVYLTEVFVERPGDGESRARVPPETRVREVLWIERARARQAPLTSDARLDALARDAAERMRREGAPEPGDLGQRALGLGRRISAVDVFVASEAADASRSANVRDGRFRRVGVGVAVGDSPRFGADRLWIAVVFTD